MTPSLIIGDGNWAVKSDSLLGYKTIDGKYYPREFTFTRATTGTRVNEAGLVELVPYNLVQRSQEFENGVWSKVRSTVTDNTTTAPDGTLTADSLIATATSGSHYIFQGFTALTNTFTISVYAKVNGYNGLRINTGTSTNGYASFDLANVVNGGGGTYYISSTMTDVGDGWYRCVVTFGSQAGSQVVLGIENGFENSNFTGDGTSGLYLWGAQLVEGTEPLDYLPTTDRLDIARIDYSTGEAALLLEPQRTNLFQRSEEFNDAYWTKNTSTITTNATTAPSGTATADKLIGNSGATFSGVQRNMTVTNATAYTISVYLKAAEATWLQVIVSGVTGTSPGRLWVDLSNGVLGTNNGGFTSASIENRGNGWYRVLATFTTTSTSSQMFFAAADGDNINAFTGNGVNGLFLWGAQLEAGAYATSYIPTTSASVTRNYDIPSLTNVYTNGFITSSGGTWFTHFVNNVPRTRDSGGGVGLRLSNVAANNVFHISTPSGSNQRYWIVSQVDTTTATSVLGGFHKLAFAYKLNDFVAYVDGVQIMTDTSGSVPTCSNLYVGIPENGAVASGVEGLISQATLYKERLSNSELATLTTL